MKHWMKQLCGMRVVLVLLLALCAGCTGQRTPGEDPLPAEEPQTVRAPDLVGVWHASEAVGSGYAMLYYFHADGTYLYTGNSMNGADRIRAAAGTWEQEGNTLYLTPARLLYIEGGVVVQGNASMVYDITGGVTRLIHLEEDGEFPDELLYPHYRLPLEQRVEHIESERRSVLIDNVRYYAFYYPSDMEDYNNAFLASDTLEEFDARIGYEERDASLYIPDDFYQNYLGVASGGWEWRSGAQQFAFYDTGRFVWQAADWSQSQTVTARTEGHWWVEAEVLYLTASSMDGQEIPLQDREIEAYDLYVDRNHIQSYQVRIGDELFGRMSTRG